MTPVAWRWRYPDGGYSPAYEMPVSDSYKETIFGTVELLYTATVPREPTERMLHAARTAMRRIGEPVAQVPANIWRAMYDAATDGVSGHE